MSRSINSLEPAGSAPSDVPRAWRRALWTASAALVAGAVAMAMLNRDALIIDLSHMSRMIFCL